MAGHHVANLMSQSASKCILILAQQLDEPVEEKDGAVWQHKGIEYVSIHIVQLERERECVCVFVYERERERERKREKVCA